MTKPTHKKFDEEHITKIKNDLNKWLGPEWGASFDRSKNKAQWFLDNEEQLLTNNNFVKNYDIDDLINIDANKMKAMYSKQPDFDKLTEQQLKRFTTSNNISREELKRYYDTENERIAEMKAFNDARYNVINQERAEAERAKDDSYYNSPLANEYARKAYIQGDNNLARNQEIFGKVAAAADFAPLPISLVGPTLRTAQKGMAGEDILTPGTGFDVAGAVVPDFLEKPAKLAAQLIKGKVGPILSKTKIFNKVEDAVKKREIMEAAEAAKDKGIRQVNADAINPDMLTNEEILDLYRNIDDPNIKKSLEGVRQARENLESAKHVAQGTVNIPQVSKDNIMEAAYKKLEDANNAYMAASKKARPGKELMSNISTEPILTGGNFNPYYKDVPLGDLAAAKAVSDAKPNMTDNLIYNALTLGGRKLERSTLGGRFGNWNTFTYEPSYDEEKALDEIEKMYSGDWTNGEAIPGMDDGLKKKAYDRWLEKLRRTPGNYNVIWRVGE